MIEIIEQAILNKLIETEMFKGMDIEPFPENFLSYPFISALGCILVRFDGSQYTKPQTLSSVMQEETFSFSVCIGFRNIDKIKETYPVLEEIKNSLTGLTVSGKKLYPKKREYLGHINGDVYYNFVFEITVPVFEQLPPDNLYTFSTFAASKKKGS